QAAGTLLPHRHECRYLPEHGIAKPYRPGDWIRGRKTKPADTYPSAHSGSVFLVGLAGNSD
ncbi:MAG: hypothetical protein FWD88_00065, partial [Treponema sp.]|nr:hypothetical protein [Treponema sp.]